VEPLFRPTDVGELVRVLVVNSDLVAERNVDLRIDSVVIAADAAKVERIVENLLGNTVKHTPVTARIWVRVLAWEGGALILVEDDGPGIAPDQRERIFEAFLRGDAPSHAPGVGVGLALVARFAELHDGSAWVEERVGGGASFRVFLPSRPAGYLPDPIDGVEEDSGSGGGSAEGIQAQRDAATGKSSSEESQA
jgi:signal transduction histidine kinase